MSKQYGPKKGKSVFYASINKGKLSGVEGRAEGGKVNQDELIAAAGALGEKDPVIAAMQRIARERIKKAEGGSVEPLDDQSPFQMAMMDDPRSRGSKGADRFGNLPSGGGGGPGGGGVPTTARAPAPKMSNEEYASKHRELQELKANVMRLGPMRERLIELGATPEQMRAMDPAQAYKFIKNNGGFGGQVKPGWDIRNQEFIDRIRAMQDQLTSQWQGIGKAGGGPTISPDIKVPWAARSANYGLRAGKAKGPVIGTTPGRADAKPVSVDSGSYVVPADIVSAIGQGNSGAGHKTIMGMFSGKRKYGAGAKFKMTGMSGMKFAAGGATQDVPIAISDGEHVISPEEVASFGDGDMKTGHDRLDKWVMGWRKKNIKQLRRLKPPKKD
jgi:hypothetical protein